MWSVLLSSQRASRISAETCDLAVWNSPCIPRTDFNGRTTAYTYDTLNRLLSKAADPYFVTNHIGAAGESFTYTATGKRATMADASGTTTYGYDNRDRVTSKATPEGTLAYTYDAAGDVKTIASSNANGASMSYGYDALDRLASVTDAAGATSYGYDNVGNLQTMTYPNGVAHGYTYDTRNRLTNLGVKNATASLESYGYTLDAAGHRTSVTEQSGRKVNYSYDTIYRLTNETIAGDPNAMNGAVSYTYDNVGNRLQKTSTLPGFPGGSSTYNANDELTTDQYDADGNTIGSGLNTGTSGYVYDFENRLVQQGGISIVYDGDGNRVSKSTANATTQYLVDDLNPTGYAQVMDEVQSSSVVRTYTWGFELVSELFPVGSPLSTNHSPLYYVFDGHGSVRALTNAAGAITDSYDYDAFGVLTHSTGTTPNNYLFAGEQFDPDLSLYYNRARYLNTSTGRFRTMDNFEGVDESPSSLNKFGFAQDNPIDNADPSGNQIDDLAAAATMSMTLDAMPSLQLTGVQTTTAKLGIGIEVPDKKAINNNVFNVAIDSGHVFVYFRDSTNKVVSILSFGPGAFVLDNKDLFTSGGLPGNAHWHLTGQADTFESKITSPQLEKGKQLIADFQAHVPNYSPQFECTSASLSIARQVGLTLPDGVGPVIAVKFGKTYFSGNASNPYHLDQQMKSLFGPPQVVDTSTFPKP
jgi:RHS repeat-associated protein